MGDRLIFINSTEHSKQVSQRLHAPTDGGWAKPRSNASRSVLQRSGGDQL
jgi:hypothetical protein